MNIVKQLDNEQLTVYLSGSLDTNTAPELEKELHGALDNITSLIIDFEHIDYVSSAGLRVLLISYRTMSEHQGKIILRKVNPSVMGVLTMTGFTRIFTIEN